MTADTNEIAVDEPIVEVTVTADPEPVEAEVRTVLEESRKNE